MEDLEIISFPLLSSPIKLGSSQIKDHKNQARKEETKESFTDARALTYTTNLLSIETPCRPKREREEKEEKTGRQ